MKKTEWAWCESGFVTKYKKTGSLFISLYCHWLVICWNCVWFPWILTYLYLYIHICTNIWNPLSGTPVCICLHTRKTGQGVGIGELVNIMSNVLQINLRHNILCVRHKQTKKPNFRALKWKNNTFSLSVFKWFFK